MIRRSTVNNVVSLGPLNKFHMPPDTKHLFCDECWAMYQKNKCPENHIVLAVHPDSRGAEMAGMMPLLKAWAAFMDYFTGTQTTFTLAKMRIIKVSEDVEENGDWKKNTSSQATVRMTIGDDEFSSKRGSAFFSESECYAYMNQQNYIRFKSGLSLGKGDPVLTPEEALTFMVHEFTSHRFNKNYSYRRKTEEYEENHKHYVAAKPHSNHCATGARGHSKCLNGFTDINFNNTLNALPFFKKWYDDHKDDPLTMYDSSMVPTPPPAIIPPRRPLGSPAPSPAPRTRLGSPATLRSQASESLEEEVTDIVENLLDPPLHPPPPPPPSTEPAAYLAVVPVIPEEADIEEIVELD